MGAIETLPFNKTPTEHTPVGGVHGSFFVTAVSMEVLGVRNGVVFGGFLCNGGRYWEVLGKLQNFLPSEKNSRLRLLR